MFRFIVVSLVLGSLMPLAVQADDNAIAPELKRFGMGLFVQNCAICHGETGLGDGVLATEFVPSPRNFSTGTFKFRTSDIEEPPTRADLIRTIERGIEGSGGRSMPAFPDFTPSEQIALAEVVRQFADIDAYGTPLVVPPQPQSVDLEEGRALYAELGCVSCHGENGGGDGELAADLEDENGHPIPPANFILGKLKGGTDVTDIWFRIHNGVNGTPMPSFGRNLSALEIWQLSYYIKEIAEQ